LKKGFKRVGVAVERQGFYSTGVEITKEIEINQEIYYALVKLKHMVI